MAEAKKRKGKKSEFDEAAELLGAMGDLCKEKNISTDFIINALETALVTAYKRNFNSAQNVKVTIDRVTGQFKVYAEKEVVENVEEGDVSRKSFKRLHRWRYSPTAAYGNNEVHLHPYRSRRLTVAEAMAIQSLPKWFELPPNLALTEKFKMIGNGVPYLMAFELANTIRDFFQI